VKIYKPVGLPLLTEIILFHIIIRDINIFYSLHAHMSAQYCFKAIVILKFLYVAEI